MKTNEDLETLKRKTGIEDFELVSRTEFQNVQELAAKGKISKEDMMLLVEVIPNFVQLQQTYVDGLKTLISSAKETQKDALQGISKTLDGITDLLSVIADNAETEELKSKILDSALKLGEYGIEVAKILHETNKENNQLFKDIAKYIGYGLAVTAGAVTSLYVADKMNKKS